ncbi:Ku protein [Streptomyces sp. NBC_01352]|uniref:non-homologous end joining protein Ku n=1 Tax=unclassified Streptomyces TaxID=2593676 RepID=UPI00224EF1A8|nr:MULTISPECIES: Ku protein [unclassified Streptomyces]MCX4706588.1 Ku protein [Streptomyces sp. NBC_01373]
MPQAIAKLSISWGLVAIPVTVHAATAPHPVPLHQVHTRCGGGRVRLHRFCEREGVEVPYDEVAPGWEADDGRVVVLSNADLADLPLPNSPRAIEVLAFVPADRIDPLLLHRPYYLGVRGGPAAARPYALLRDAMRENGLVAVVRLALRGRESLALLRVREQVITMQPLLWPDELRPTEDIAVPRTEPPRRQELDMARSLMDAMSTDFRLEEQHDDYRHAVEQVVAARLAGSKPPHAHAHAPAPVTGAVVDLMAVLEQSVEEVEERRRTSPAAKKGARAKKTEKANPATAPGNRPTG